MSWRTIIVVLVVFVIGYAARGIWPNLIPFKLPLPGLNGSGG